MDRELRIDAQEDERVGALLERALQPPVGLLAVAEREPRLADLVGRQIAVRVEQLPEDAPRLFPLAAQCTHARERCGADAAALRARHRFGQHRSEEHTSELQSQSNLVCRLLLEKKKKPYRVIPTRITTSLRGG